MKNIIEIRTNAIYSASPTGNELKPEIEVILIHTNGKQYVANKNNSGIQTIPLIQETRFIANMEEIDRLIADLQKTKLQMTAIEQNCRVLNGIVEHLNTKKD